MARGRAVMGCVCGTWWPMGVHFVAGSGSDFVVVMPGCGLRGCWVCGG